MTPSDLSQQFAHGRANDPLRVIMFQQRFSNDVEAGRKTQTIRPVGKRSLPKLGLRVSLRMWSGKPYRSGQVILRETRLIRVAEFRANWEERALWVDGIQLNDMAADRFARADGFSDLAAMASWFQENHKATEFHGFVMHWAA